MSNSFDALVVEDYSEDLRFKALAEKYGFLPNVLVIGYFRQSLTLRHIHPVTGEEVWLPTDAHQRLVLKDTRPQPTSSSLEFQLDNSFVAGVSPAIIEARWEVEAEALVKAYAERLAEQSSKQVGAASS